MKRVLSRGYKGVAFQKILNGYPFIISLSPNSLDGVSDSTHVCKSDIRVLVNAFQCFGWGVCCLQSRVAFYESCASLDRRLPHASSCQPMGELKRLYGTDAIIASEFLLPESTRQHIARLRMRRVLCRRFFTVSYLRSPI